MQEIKSKMISFLQKEVETRGFEKVVFGLSGGIDSTVVAYLCKEAFGNRSKALLMPSLKSSDENFKDAKMLVELLGIPYEIIPLEPYEKVFCDYDGMDNVRYGNFCARARMMLLYDMSQKEKSLVVGTSNKTERILGYGTIYGDLACAINPIGDLLKTDVFKLANFLGIPEKIISKKPSADLYEGQSDEDEFGYSYEQIDELLREIIQKNLLFCNFSSISDRIDKKYPKIFTQAIFQRIQKNCFKTQGPKHLLL